MKVTLYNDINDKKRKHSEPSLSSTESLIQCLDVLDFNRALSKSGKHLIKKYPDVIKWIELNFRKK